MRLHFLPHAHAYNDYNETHVDIILRYLIISGTSKSTENKFNNFHKTSLETILHLPLAATPRISISN